MVEVKGTTFLADGALVATRVHREDRDFDGRDGDESEVEGFVTRFGSATDFDVDGQKVATDASTTFVNGTADDLKLNVKVEVEGKFDSTDTLVAAKVVFKRRSSLRLSAMLDSVDVTGGTFRALGVTVVVSSTTRKEDHEGDDHLFSLDDLRAGDWVEEGGYADSAGTGNLIATRLERDDPLQTPFNESYPALSPDGRLLAYTSNESGRGEIYVQSLGEDGGKWQISTDGGYGPRWLKGGEELVFMSLDDKAMSVDIQFEPEFSPSVPRVLFETKAPAITGMMWDATADGNRFLINRTIDAKGVVPVTIVQNWPAALGK